MPGTLTAPTATTDKFSHVQDFDDLLEVVGSYGRYQKQMLYLFFMPACFFIAFTMNLFLFQMVVPDYWCHAPGRKNTSLSVAEWHNLTRPRSSETGKLSSCLRYEINFISDGNASRYSVINETKECSDGWEFDTSQFSATVATTLGWVCERDHYSHFTLSASMAGNAVGTFVLPLLADKYVGRRLIFFVALGLHVVFTVPLLWVTGTILHMVIRFLQGLSFQTHYLMSLATFMELIPPERRALAVMLSFLSWTFGMCFTALVAWLVPHWQHLAIISIFPSLLGFLYWRFLPESPRWLLSKGKVRQSADILLNIGATNGAPLVSRTKMEAQLHVLMLRQPVAQPLSALLAYPKLTTRAVMLLLM
ncbi:solute carrier family 22 member 7-like [Eriocheir sinensis]|uniref:solute carrier family 22 member 7-like n=1 Tax=Eriocheir sinensis TaxID=95602 RepID=UPI0021C7DCBC|nr:solute carrier family 22 member 7-like [Eriocheir sinensis]